MALIECPECKREVSDTATACPHCGKALQATTGKDSKTGGAIIGAVVGFGLGFFMVSIYLSDLATSAFGGTCCLIGGLVGAVVGALIGLTL